MPLILCLEERRGINVRSNDDFSNRRDILIIANCIFKRARKQSLLEDL